MKLIQFDTSGVKFMPKRGRWLGSVAMTFKLEGENVAHNVEVKVRAKGSLSQSYHEAEEAIRAEAVSVLSQAIDTLRGSTFEDIEAGMDK
jgi:hypothetical protein